MLVDTGASNTVIDLKVAEALALTLDTVEELGGGLGTSQAKISSSSVDVFKIGAFQLNAFQLYIMDLTHVNASLEARGSPPCHGVIGVDILAGRAAIIDYSTRQLYLK